MKAKKLPTLLEGELLATWLKLREEQKVSCDAKAKMIERLGLMQFVLMNDFYHRRLLPSESLLFSRMISKDRFAKPCQKQTPLHNKSC